MSEVLTVTRLARRMRNLLEIQVGKVWVQGEVSNLRKQASGHWYFVIKDQGAELSCAMFAARRKPGSNALENGSAVKILGEVSLYEARGQAQIIVEKAEDMGAGDLQAQFEALKQKLNAEGLFALEKKQKLPFFPRVVGIVTSESGAALQDIMNVLQRRAPWTQVLLFPVPVQGKGAELKIARAIEQADAMEAGPEVLIVGRGGGSLEDLWNFNEEVVVRAIVQCQAPVVSAVGHEIDFTLADLAADLRAPTPSAAAELVVPEGEELKRRLENLEQRLEIGAKGFLKSQSRELEHYRGGILLASPERVLREPTLRMAELRHRLSLVLDARLEAAQSSLEQRVGKWERQEGKLRLGEKRNEVFESKQRMERALEEQLRGSKERLKRLGEKLRLLGPQATLNRGFSLVTDEKGRPLTDAREVKKGQTLRLEMAKGQLEAKVTEVISPS